MIRDGGHDARKKIFREGIPFETVPIPHCLSNSEKSDPSYEIYKKPILKKRIKIPVTVKHKKSTTAKEKCETNKLSFWDSMHIFFTFACKLRQEAVHARSFKHG